jgi:hypothetical protein
MKAVFKTTMTLAMILALACVNVACGGMDRVPIAQVHGALTDQRVQPSATESSVYITLAWYNINNGMTYYQPNVEVSTLPAQFDLTLLSAPKAAFVDHRMVGDDHQESATYAVGYFIATNMPFTGPKDDFAPAGTLLGIAADHVVACLRNDLTPGGFWASKFHADLGQGCHLLQVHRATDSAKADFEACLDEGTDPDSCFLLSGTWDDPFIDDVSPAPAGFDTPIQLEILEHTPGLPIIDII